MISSRAKQLEKPMAHQAVSLAHDAKTDLVFDTSDPGTGKTAVRVWAYAKRRRAGKAGKLLVLGPRTILKSTWINDFKKFAPDMKAVVAPAEKREEAFAIDADVYITNHDAVKWLIKQPKQFWAQFTDLVNDESTAYKHHSSQRSRAMLKIAHMKLAMKPVFKHKANLTATPNSNGICDLWHQVQILDGGKRLGPSFFAFRGSVCDATQVGRSAQAIRWTDKDGAEEAVFGLLNDIVIRHKFEDCVDIPATYHYTTEYELPAKQRKAYDTLEKTSLLMLQGATAKTLTAVNAAAVATKLLQIASGAVYDNAGKYHLVDTGRYELITEMIEARKHSLVFFHWKHQKEQLTKHADAAGFNYCVLDGDASDKDREQMVQAYQAGAYRVMFAHPRSAAHGLTLTKGTSTIWAGPSYDLELFQQGNKRQARIGQKEKTEVIVVIAKDTIEEKVYEMLMGKNARMSNLLDLFASMSPVVKYPVKAKTKVLEVA